MMKKIAIIYTKYNPTIDAIKYQLKDCKNCKIDYFTSFPEKNNYDLIILSEYFGKYEGNVLRCHHSLLPAFEGEEPEKQAILSGVKVSGITIYYTNPTKIIAQYPVFIYNDAHYDELKQELNYIEQTLFPLVIEKIIKNEPFEVRALLNKKQYGCSGGCIGCKH